MRNTFLLFFLLFSPAMKAEEASSVDIIKDATAALIFGLGPLQDSSSNGHGCIGDHFSKWKDGTTVEIFVPTSGIAPNTIELLQREIKHLPRLTSDRLKAFVRSTLTFPEKPNDDQIVMYVSSDLLNKICKTTPGKRTPGCAIAEINEQGEIVSGKYIAAADDNAQVAAHEIIGHLLLGLCHIRGTGFEKAISLMSFGPEFYQKNLPIGLTDLDQKIVRTIYSTSLDAGAGPKEFRNHDLIY